jgi:radical SAM protein with 4Fe4S-binding SPASM domain
MFQNEEDHRNAGGPVYRKTPLAGLHLEITNACNLRCSHCYVSSGKRLPDELTTEEIFGVVDQLSSFSGKRIAVSGGEPTIHPDISTIIDYCAVSCGHAVDLYTNGVRFPDGLARHLAELRERDAVDLTIQISLEGATSRSNDAVRGLGSFVATLRTLDMLNSLGLHRAVTLFVCVTKQNLGELDDIAALAERLDVSTLVFSQWQRQGNASAIPWSIVGPTTPEWIAAGERLLRHKSTRLNVFGNFFGDLNNDPFGRYALDSPLFPKHIYSYNAFPRIAPDGTVFADQLFVDPDWSLGNVRDRSLEQMFDSPAFYEQIERMRGRPQRIAECRACVWQPLCEGGSPGHTLSEYGHLDERDVFCDSRIYWFERFVRRQVARATEGAV